MYAFNTHTHTHTHIYMFCNVMVNCAMYGFLMCGCAYVWFCIVCVCNVWCVCVSGFFNVWLCVCIGCIMCGYVCELDL
jgi:hypothetical protein